MKRISYWALLNPWKSQSILILCHLMLAVVAIYGGVLLFAHDVLLPKTLIYVGEALFFILLLCYPIRRARYRFWKTSYVKQKAMDAGLVLSYLLMTVTLTNESAKIAWHDTSDVPTVRFIAMKETVAAAPKTNVLSKKVLRQQFKSWVKNMKVKGETGDLVGEAIIVMLLLILLTFALLALACTIACASSTTLSFFALVAFELFIVVLLIMGIKNALIKRKANYKPTPKG